MSAAKVRPGRRGSRPRTKTRPEHADAERYAADTEAPDVADFLAWLADFRLPDYDLRVANMDKAGVDIAAMASRFLFRSR